MQRQRQAQSFRKVMLDKTLTNNIHKMVPTNTCINRSGILFMEISPAQYPLSHSPLSQQYPSVLNLSYASSLLFNNF
jgi:hypothetical protein